MRRRGALPPVGAAVLLLLAACSGDDGDASPSTTSPGTVTTVTTGPGAAGAPTTGAGPASSTSAAPATTAATGSAAPATTVAPTFTLQAFPVPAGTAPHDVSPAAEGGVWFTAQGSGQLGLLDPATGQSRLIDLGDGSRPHGVITAPDGAAWVTDGGRNSLIRYDPAADALTEYPLPAEAANANLNTAVIAPDGVLWFTGQNGWYGRLQPGGTVEAFPAPRGRGPYGITATANGEVYYASLAGSHIARIDPATAAATVLEPPVAGQGSRRVWADAGGRVWVSAWNSGDLFAFEPFSGPAASSPEAAGSWRSWRLPGERPQPYAVYVDDVGDVWLSDFGANTLVRFDPSSETFTSFPLPSPGGSVRQLHGRPGEVWGAESAADQLVVVRRSS